jgi:predicted TIM-barrel fold metal-dependent hydrolase
VLVDHQAHWYPRAALKLLTARDAYPRAQRADGGYRYEHTAAFTAVLGAPFVELDLQLADMDANAISLMVCNPALCLGDVTGFELGLAVEMCEVLNAELACAQREHQSRMVGIASLPWQAPDAALRVLERAVAQHDLRGVSVHANVNGTPIATDELMPVYRRIEELALPLVLHPTAPSTMGPAYARCGDSVEMIAWLFDTSAAALSLIYARVLDRCPGLTVLHPHLGGVLPYLRTRIESLHRAPGRDTDHPIEHYFRTNFRVDSVTTTPRAYAMAEDLYGGEGIVFGSDYPFVPRAAVQRFLRDELGTDGWEALAARSLNWGSRRP